MAIITIPDRKLVRASSIASSKGWDKKTDLSTQRNNLKLQPNLLGKHISNLLDEPIQGQKVVVLAGFTGEYSHTLHKAGFDVTHTDILDCYVEEGRKKGLQAMKAHAESPPKLDGVDIYSTFEFVPIHPNRGGEMLMFLETVAHSKHGFIETSVWDNSSLWEHFGQKYEFKTDSIKDTIATYNNSNDEVTGYVVRYHASEQQKHIFKTDLAVINALQMRTSFEISKLTNILKIRARILRESLKRINETCRLKKHPERVATTKEVEIN
jgi:hypothetical protein